MRLTPVADHVVAAVRLLGGRRARRARRGVQLHVLEGSYLLFCELVVLARWLTPDEFAVPGLVATRAKGKVAVFADGEEVGRVIGLQTTAAGRLLFFVLVVVVVVIVQL